MLSTRFRIAGAAVGAAALSVCAALALPSAPQFSAAGAPAALSAAPEEDSFLLIDYEGELCVFSGKRLIQRTGIPVSALPAADREQLQEGIPAVGRRELYALLEDLAS